MAPPTRLPKELDLPQAFELTRKLVTSTPEADLPAESCSPSVRRLALVEDIAATTPAKPEPLRPQGGALRYWLWRLAGRPALQSGELDALRQYDHDRRIKRERDRVAELARLTETLQRAHENESERLRSATAQAEAEASALRQRMAELQRMSEAEMARLHEGHAAGMLRTRAEAAQERDELMAPLYWDLDQARARIAELERELATARAFPGNTAALAEAQTRATAAEERARLAENKVEMLKDALDIAKSRSGAPAAADTRFRDAKRAFARAFHPDQGGRGDDERQRMFLSFWPELERIEREG